MRGKQKEPSRSALLVDERPLPLSGRFDISGRLQGKRLHGSGDFLIVDLHELRADVHFPLGPTLFALSVKNHQLLWLDFSSRQFSERWPQKWLPDLIALLVGRIWDPRRDGLWRTYRFKIDFWRTIVIQTGKWQDAWRPAYFELYLPSGEKITLQLSDFSEEDPKRVLTSLDVPAGFQEINF
jgi:hypothetical protein